MKLLGRPIEVSRAENYVSCVNCHVIIDEHEPVIAALDNGWCCLNCVDRGNVDRSLIPLLARDALMLAEDGDDNG